MENKYVMENMKTNRILWTGLVLTLLLYVFSGGGAPIFGQTPLQKPTAPKILSTELDSELKPKPPTPLFTENDESGGQELNIAAPLLPELSDSEGDSDDKTDHGEHKPHGTELLGVEPGVTRLSDLEGNPVWKKPGHKEVIEGFLILTYRIEDLPDMPFIQILLRKEVVEGIVIHLKEPRELKDTKLSFQQAIRNVRPIVIPDREGGFREIYPEKGLAFVLEKGEKSTEPSSRVTQIIAEPVRANYLVIRAEQTINSSPENAYRDVSHAVLHEPNNGPANWMLAKFELEHGENLLARKHAIRAVKSDSKIPQYQLTLVSALIANEEWDNASKVLQVARPLCKDYPLFKSEIALSQGDIYRKCDDPDFDRAEEEFASVQEIVKPYLRSDQQEVRVLMKKQSLKGFLAQALNAAGRKTDNVLEKEKAWQYLDAASGVADNLIKKEKSDPTPLWEVCLTASEVALFLPEAREINPYIQTLKRVAADLVRKGEPKKYSISEIRWRSGQALANGFEIYQKLENASQAISCGEKALEFMMPIMEKRSVQDQLKIARLLASMGAFLIEKFQNHQEGITRLDRAVSLVSGLQKQFDVQESVEAGVLFVKISRYYWTGKEENKAISITQEAVEMLDSAYKEGVGNREDLRAAYTNLAMMYQKIGKRDLAKKCALSAKDLE